MKRVLALVVFVAVVSAVHLETRPPAPQPQRDETVAPDTSTPVARGRLVYARYGCAACHGPDGKGGFANTNAETDGKVPSVVYVAEGFTRAELKKKVLDGLATVGRKDPKGPQPPYRMPGWRGVMTDADAGDLVEFLFSLYPKTETQSWR